MASVDWILLIIMATGVAIGGFFDYFVSRLEKRELTVADISANVAFSFALVFILWIFHPEMILGFGVRVERDPKLFFVVALFTPFLLRRIPIFNLWQVEAGRTAKLDEVISKAEQAVEKEPEKTRPVWDLSRAQLELYINRNLSQVRNIFWITIVVMTAGFCMVVYGVYRAFDAQLQVAILTTAAGLITQTIGATFLLIYRSTMKQANDYVSTLERINAVGMAVAIVDLIPDEKGEAKTKARVDLVKQILVGQTRKPTLSN